MTRTIEFLSPREKLIDAVVDWLCGDARCVEGLKGRVRDDEGAASLAHVMVVVPTAQSGRNLRLELAKRCGGVLPPRVVLPMQLVKPAEETFREATDAELVAAFLKFLDLNCRSARDSRAQCLAGCAREVTSTTGGEDACDSRFTHLFRSEALTDMSARLSLWDQLSDIWHILAGGGLVMSDVLACDTAHAVLEEAAGEELERWRELAALESAFFDFLHERGICHPTENVRRAKERPQTIDRDIREVVLPALADPIRVLKDVLLAQRPDLKVTVLLHADPKDAAKFDAWGRPITSEWIGSSQPELSQFESGDIVLGADTSDLARRVVADFPAAGSHLALPSLALADGETFPEVASAFLNAGYVVHNPERHALAVSSLGRLVRVLVELYRLKKNRGEEVAKPVDAIVPIASCGMDPSSLDAFETNASTGTCCGAFSWTSFVSALRSDDVLKAIVEESALDRADILQGLDFAQNRFLPRFLPVATVAKAGENRSARDSRAQDGTGCARESRALRESEAGCAREVMSTTGFAALQSDITFPEVEVSRHDRPAYDAFLAAAKMFVSWLDAAREGHSLTAFLRQMLKKIFANRALTGSDGEDEFREAASCVWNVLNSLESEAIAGLELSDAAFDAVVRRVLDAAFYSLEPDTPDAVKTEGWLELSWSAASKFALVGFHEGAVPDSLVGHAFVPDGLRRALGLTNNDDRLARDTWLFKELLDSHGRHAVRAYVAKTNNVGDICRPSRLLYLCPRAEFPKRVGYLFGDCASESERFPRQVADRWRLRLPDEIGLPSRDEKTPLGRLSASAIDQYVKCPFTYLLKYAMGMKPVEEKVELGYDDFGSLVHRVLEVYAKEQIALGEDQLTNVDSIRAALARIVKDVTRTYGERPSVNVALQLDALAGRIGLFADIQAQWATEGWRIVERPEYPFLVQPFLSEGDDTWIKGSVDRIDFHPQYGYRIIDYKSWDQKKKVTGHIAQGGEAQTAFAACQHLPLLGDGRRLMTIQLPLYALCLGEADAKFKGKVADMCYLILGEDAENTCVFGSAFPQGDFECQKRNKISLVEIAPVAGETTRTVLRHIKGNLFWPPGPGAEWKYDIKSLLVSTPEKDMGAELDVPPDWLKSQLLKLEACK